MNTHSEWRLELARKIAPAYSKVASVEAVIVHGSVARGYADCYSDIELAVFWSQPPLDTDRLLSARRAGGVFNNFLPFDPGFHDWAEDYIVGGVKIDVSHMLTERVNECIRNVVEQYSTDLVEQSLLSVVQRSVPLSNTKLVETWRARIRDYPDSLTALMVRRHMLFKPAWVRHMLADRGEILPFYESVCVAERQIWLILLALNRIYVPHMDFKWLNRMVEEEMPIGPTSLAQRLDNIFRLDPPAGATELDRLIDETIALIEKHLPHVETKMAWQHHRFVRQTLHIAPNWLREYQITSGAES